MGIPQNVNEVIKYKLVTPTVEITKEGGQDDPPFGTKKAVPQRIGGRSVLAGSRPMGLGFTLHKKEERVARV
jgi:hypothetical protein